MAHLDALRRARELFSAAQSLASQRNLTGAAGLAYQAFDLAAKALAQALDGADPGSHRSRMLRAQRELTRHEDKLVFLWEIRQKDFYGDVRPGGRQGVPTEEEVADAIAIVGDILEDIEKVLHQ